MDLMLAAAGAMTGLLVGLTGAGSGALMTPLLLLVFGVAPATAVGTDLWFAALTKLAATRIHHGRGLIDWVVVRRLWMGSLPASAVSLAALTSMRTDAATVELLKLAIAVAVVISALGLLFQAKLHAVGRRFRVSGADRFKALQRPLTFAAGALLGVLVTLTSVGAGALGAVMLVYLYPLRLTPPRLVATDIVHAIPLAMFAGMGHLLIGNVNFALLGNLLLGSVPGVIVGAMLSARLPHGLLRAVLAVVLLVIGARLGWSVAG
jgi:uncharacterized membrane protein YfcA